MKNILGKKQNLVLMIGLGIFSFLLAWYISGLKFDLNIPIIYGEDGLFGGWYIKRLIDGAWYFSNDYTGFPFGSDFYDYPSADFGNFFLLKLLGLITGNYAVTYNVYYLLGFPVTAIVSFWVLRQFQISTAFSLLGAVLFTFLPFHFLRIGHLFYTWYFVIPLFVYVGFKIFSDKPPFFDGRKSWLSKILLVFVLLIISSFGVYYAFFGVMIFMVSGFIAWRQQKSLKYIFSALIAIGIVGLGVGINVTPNLVYKFQHGANKEIAQRWPPESEHYGLKIIQLLLPHSAHRSDFLAKANKKYAAQFPLVNENASASLGVLGSVGFLMLIYVFFMRRENKEEDPHLYWLALMTIFLVLFATIGGFSAVFALLITPMIRAWNRMSVVIGFMSIAALMIVLDQYMKKKYALRWMILLVIGLGLFGLWDQTPRSCETCLKERQQVFMNDQQFVEEIEKTVPANTAIYQLPYMAFPEVPPIHELHDYGLFKGYLHSQQLKWSYGGTKGREGDEFFKDLSTKPISAQVAIIKQLGFSGIYIDRRGYTDHAAAVEKELTQILGKPAAIVSADGNLSFFDIGR